MMLVRCFLLLFLTIIAAAPAAAGIDQRINEAVAPFTDAFSAAIFTAIPIHGVPFPLIVLWLVAAAAGFTAYLGFVNIRRFRLALKITRGDYDDPADKGEVSHFQALTAALSGTVGLGNIAGVAVAIGIGGPGATFWMIMAGLLGMSSKFVECTLAVKYRHISATGVVSGGPMYYLKKGFERRGLGAVGAILAVIFSIFCVGGSFGGGNMFQVNQAFQQVYAVTGGEHSFFAGRGWLFGLLMATVVAMVIIGGIKSIARVTSRLVPFMCGIYLAAAVVILCVHWADVPAAFAAIFEGAFSPQGIEGGILGVLIQGFRRAAFSNEAGLGSAPIAHAAVRTNEPVTEGLVALLEPFVDTVIVCTATALVIVITGTYATAGLDGVAMTSAAFASVIGWFPVLLSLAVVLFAFSTLISWSYYGLKAWTYLFGESTVADLSYKLLFCTATVIGATMSLGKVVDFSDAAIFAMSLPNIVGLYLMAPEVKRDLQSFVARVGRGEIVDRRVALDRTGQG